jgi:hypothetical protein
MAADDSIFPLKEFTVVCGLETMYGGNVEFAAPDCRGIEGIDPPIKNRRIFLVWQVKNLGLEVEDFDCLYTEGLGQLAINGVVFEITPEFGCPGKEGRLKFGSVFDFLSDLSLCIPFGSIQNIGAGSINTGSQTSNAIAEQNLHWTSANAFRYVFWATGIDPIDHLNIADGIPKFKICGEFQVGNTWQFLKDIAQASGIELFVNCTGTLEGTKVRLPKDPVDCSIPQEAIITATQLNYNSNRYGSARVRGPKNDRHKKGFSRLNGKRQFELQHRDSSSYCYCAGICRVKTPIEFTNLIQGDQNGYFTFYDGALSSANWNLEQAQPGAGDVNLGLTWFPAFSGSSINYTQTDLIYDFAVYGWDQLQGEQHDEDYFDKMELMFDIFGDLGLQVPSYFVNSGANEDAGSKFRNRASSYLASEKDPYRCEIVVKDTCVSETQGCRIFEISNKFACSKAQLFHIGVLELLKEQMREDQWELETAYIARLRVNDVVNFRVPDSCNCDLDVICGVVRKITLDHDCSKPHSKMTIQIHGFSRIIENILEARDEDSDKVFKYSTDQLIPSTEDSLINNYWWFDPAISGPLNNIPPVVPTASNTVHAYSAEDHTQGFLLNGTPAQPAKVCLRLFNLQTRECFNNYELKFKKSQGDITVTQTNFEILDDPSNIGTNQVLTFVGGQQELVLTQFGGQPITAPLNILPTENCDPAHVVICFESTDCIEISDIRLCTCVEPSKWAVPCANIEAEE